MSQIKTMQQLFKRERRSGDLIFALLFLAFAIFLLANIGNQTQWVKGTKLVSQPSFWPAISLAGMTLFGILHLIGSILSPRIYGRLKEIGFWLRSLEYVAWFLAYVWLVPIIGYLLATLIFMPLLVFRAGYREKRLLLLSMIIGLTIVVVFKSFLSVKIPGGMIYEYLPDAMRSFMLINF